MSAEHLPDRDTLVCWLRQADHDIERLTDKFDQAMEAISQLADHHYVERCESDAAIADLFDTLHQVRSILRRNAWDNSTCRKIAEVVNVATRW